MLHIGMLWFDDTPKRPLGEKIELAASHYERKYGRRPNVCYLNEGSLSGQVDMKRPIRVVGLKDVLPYHFWVGVSDFESNSDN